MIYGKKIAAVCIARIQDGATNEYITALNRAVQKIGYGLFVYNTCSVVGEEDMARNPQMAVYDIMDYEILDVVIVFEEVMRNRTVSDELVRRAESHGIPVIIIGERKEGCINLQYDHKNEFAGVVRHMIQDHHLKKLHLMAGIKGNVFSEYRLNSFREVLEENGIVFREDMVSYGDFNSVIAEAEMEKLILSGKLPEAVLCANDRMAIAVCDVLSRHGIRVPEDVAVTGFDGITEIAITSPRITSVICAAEDLAAKTAEILRQMDGMIGKTETFLVPTRLCVAESCGCKGEKTQNISGFLNAAFDNLYRFQEEELVLSQVTARMLRCETTAQVAEQMRHEILYDMCCIVELDCVDEKVNPAECGREHREKDREMLVLFDSDSKENFVPYQFGLKEITPHLDYMLAHGRALIFTALYHADVPLGYVCFFFSELNEGNYMKIPQTVNALNNGIGGFRNLRYRQFLMSRIESMYQTDTLTGLYNRRGFETEYQKLLENRKENGPLTIVLADLDRLKYINDTFGHKEGDFAIYAVAQALVKVCPEGALFTRFGGDEMLGVCCGALEPEVLKERFIQYFKEFNAKSGKEYKVEASVGIYVTGEQETLNFEGLIEKSDGLMYAEKQRRRREAAGSSGR
ncbi:MAG: GGDEF domain-containing protein [Lachnospiraceae bacterium]|nr:GGDEF domain-containing protein [Lachnospiraceae bacterium]